VANRESAMGMGSPLGSIVIGRSVVGSAIYSSRCRRMTTGLGSGDRAGNPSIHLFKQCESSFHTKLVSFYLLPTTKTLPPTSYRLVKLSTIGLTSSVNLWTRKGKMWDVLWVSR
jgi:hypothetical protein